MINETDVYDMAMLNALDMLSVYDNINDDMIAATAQTWGVDAAELKEALSHDNT